MNPPSNGLVVIALVDVSGQLPADGPVIVPGWSDVAMGDRGNVEVAVSGEYR